jgi:hypothetical protein
MSDASLGPWLGHVRGLLSALAPRGLAVVHGVSMDSDAMRIGRLPEEARVQESTAGFDPRANAGGWLVRLYVRDQSPPALLLAIEEDLDENSPLLVMGFALCRLGWRLRERQPLPAGPVRVEMREAIHALRNGLNSVAMTSAVLNSPMLPADLRSFGDDLDKAVGRSLQSLRDLSTLISPE